MGRRRDLIGHKQGRITVVREVNKNTSNKRMWEYLCECGKLKVAETSVITRRRFPIVSCGCLAKERIGNLNRKNYQESSKNRLLANYKRSAKRRGIDFLLTEDQFFSLINQSCHYCGIEPSNTTEVINPHGFGHIKFNGIDRVDNDVGYVYTNCVTCCRNCNMAKYAFNYSEFLEWIKRITNYVNSRSSNK